MGAGIIAGSMAMIGDSATMFVDSMTYLFNLIAERKKDRFDETFATTETDPERAYVIQEQAKRKMTLTWELVPPLISIMTLNAVTIYILQDAVHVLILNSNRPASEQRDPNLNLMIIFSSLNLGLDVFNVFCFARAKHLFGYRTSTEAKESTNDNRSRILWCQRRNQNLHVMQQGPNLNMCSAYTVSLFVAREYCQWHYISHEYSCVP